jgi:hypothetical protein
LMRPVVIPTRSPVMASRICGRRRRRHEHKQRDPTEGYKPDACVIHALGSTSRKSLTSRLLPRQHAHIRHSPSPIRDHTSHNTCGRHASGHSAGGHNTCSRDDPHSDGSYRHNDDGHHGNDRGDRHDRDRQTPPLETTEQRILHKRERTAEAFGPPFSALLSRANPREGLFPA